MGDVLGLNTSNASSVTSNPFIMENHIQFSIAYKNGISTNDFLDALPAYANGFARIFYENLLIRNTSTTNGVQTSFGVTSASSISATTGSGGPVGGIGSSLNLDSNSSLTMNNSWGCLMYFIKYSSLTLKDSCSTLTANYSSNKFMVFTTATSAIPTVNATIHFWW